MPTANAARPAADPEAVRRLMHHGLTERQATAFLFIFAGAQRDGFQPAYREVMVHMGVKSLNAVSLYVNGLERGGFVKRNGSGNRSLRLLKRPDGRPFCGFMLPEDAP
jgi:SOS-response transcriptional repressor LexA